ncbi:MAG: hypothetical protein AAF739_12260 [Pseudomonadota bacterium]
MDAKLFDESIDCGTAETLSKRGFAEQLGISATRVSQMIADGLPTEPNGRISLERGRQWYAQNVDPNRKRLLGSSGDQMPYKSQRAEAEAKIAKLKADRLEGTLIDRQAALLAIEAQARTERDAWIGWVNRVAPEIARETDSELAAVVGILGRLVREQLVSIANLSKVVTDE